MLWAMYCRSKTFCSVSKLTSREYKARFNTAALSPDETHALFASRLKNLWGVDGKYRGNAVLSSREDGSRSNITRPQFQCPQH